MDLKKFSDQELLASARRLVGQEREILTEVLRHLREIERRRLFSDLGFTSLFDYCLKGLGYSESQAKRRIDAMRMIRELPQIEEKVTSGELSLSNLVQARTFFREEEKAGPLCALEKLEILASLKNKSAREGEKILLAQASVAPAPVKEQVRQVTAEISEVKFGADEKLLLKMYRLRGLLAHKNPRMKTSELIEELCDIALAKLDPTNREMRVATEKTKQKLPNIIRPTSNLNSEKAPQPQSNVKNGKALARAKVNARTPRQYISVQTESEIWQKSDGRCSHCKSQFALEIDHIIPYSLGGISQASNLRLLCRNCNQRAALKEIGEKVMSRFLT